MPAKDFDAFLDSVLSGESEQPGTVSPQATLSFDDMVSSVLDKSQKLSNTGLPQSEAMDFFQSKGWTKEHAAGIVGNLYHESAGMQPEVLGDGNKSFGLAQWNGPRREALFQYATSKNERIPSFQTQLEFVQKELEESPVNGADALRRARTVEEAAKVFSDMYERPGKPMLASRIKYANEIYNGYDGQSTGASPSSSKIAVTPPPIGGTQSDFENWTYQTVAQHAPGFAAMVRPPKSRVDLTSTSASDFDAMVSSVLDTGPQKKGEGEYDFWEGMKALGHGFLQIPREMVASGIQAVKGSEGVHTGEAQDWMDKYLEWNKEKSKEFSKKYGGPASFLPGIPLDEVAQLPQNLGYMAFITMVGLPVGMGASVIGTPAAGWVTGMAATGSAAYRMTTYQYAEQLRDFFNELSVKDRGKQMSEEEWIPVRAKYEDYIRAYGLWEAIPEAVGSALELKIISAPGKALTNKIASVLGMPEIKNRFLQILPKVTSFYGTELATEAWTQHEQGRIESEIGMRESPPTWGEALKEVAPQVVLQSTVVGGAGHIGNKVYNRATGKQTDEVNRDITGGNAPASPEDQALIDKLNTALGQTAGTGEAGGAVPAGQTPEERLRALVPPEGAAGSSVPGAIPGGGVTNVKADSPFYSVLPAVKEDIPGAAPEMNKPTAKPTTLLDTIEGLNIPEEQKAALVDGLKAKSRETESQFQQTLSQMMDMPSRSAAEAKRVREAAAVPEEDKAAQAEPGKTAQAGLGEPGSGGVGKEQSKSLLPSEKLPEKSAEESAAVFLEDINTMQSPAGRQLLLERLAREAAVQSRQESEATQGTQAIQEEAKKEASIPPKSEEKFIGQKAERTTDKLVQDLKAAVITPDTKAKTQAEVDAEQVAQLRRDLAARKKGTQPASAQVPKVEAPVTAETIPAKPASTKSKPASSSSQTIPPSKPAAPRRGPSLETLIRKPEPVSVEESLRAKAKAIKEKKKAEKAKPIRPGMRFIRKADNTEWEVYRSYAGTVEIKQVNRNKIGFIPKKSLHNNYSQIYPDLQRKEPTNVSQKEQVQQQKAEAKKEPAAGRGNREGEGEEVKPSKKKEESQPANPKVTIEKIYGNSTGRRFEAVVVNGQRKDILVRGPKDGSTPNAWGEFHPSEESRVKAIKEKAMEGTKEKTESSTPAKASEKSSIQDVGGGDESLVIPTELFSLREKILRSGDDFGKTEYEKQARRQFNRSVGHFDKALEMITSGDVDGIDELMGSITFMRFIDYKWDTPELQNIKNLFEQADELISKVSENMDKKGVGTALFSLRSEKDIDTISTMAEKSGKGDITTGQTPKSYGGEIDRIEDILALAKNGAYIRWSRNPDADIKKGKSLDHSSMTAHAGLSALEIRKDIDGAVADIASYRSIGMGDKKSFPWILQGEHVGFDTDNADLIGKPKFSGRISSALMAEINAAADLRNFIYRKSNGWHLNPDEIARVKKSSEELRGSIRLPKTYVEDLIRRSSSYFNQSSPQDRGPTVQSGLLKGKALFPLSQSTPSSSTTKLSAQQVYDAVLPITKKWKNSPEIRVYQSSDALPGIVQGKFSSRAEGVFVTMPDGSNFIALIADNLKSGDHAQMVLLHEAVGHYGIRGVLGESDNFNKVLDEVYRMYGRSGMQEIADLYGFDLNTREGQRAASEEQIARIAEKNEKRGILEKVYAVFRDWLRKAGFNLKMTYGDLRKIIADSGKFLEGGGTRNTPAQTTFSFSMQAPIFYSQMERVLLNKLPGSGSPSQMKSMIESWVKKGEFKEEEYKWSGIGEWLDGKQGKIGKQEVLDFLRKNNVQVREVWKGNKEFSNQIKEYEDYFSKLEKKYGESPLTAAISRSEEIELMRLQDQAFPDEPDTKYQQYQLPGGKSYRELLLTLPVKGLTAEDILLRDGSITTQNKNEISSGYQSSHWYEENVLVHVRFNERTDAEGNRILFVEEVQSDWHQEGKRKGYGRKEKYAVFANENAVGEFSSRTEAESALKNAGGVGEILDLSRSGVPPAPFQKTWPELAMKRVLRYAAENGFDRVAWTTGEQQADRYDLSKQVDKIAWAKNDNGKFSITILKEGDIVDLPISTKNITEEKLVDVIGKDIADKIIKSPNGSGVLRGEALKVGGEGMRGFYDKMLPAKMNAYVKKWGAKTETINIGETYQDTSDLTGKTTGRENVPVHSIPITQSMREGVLKGQALFSLSQQKLAKDIETLDRNTKEAIFGRDTDLREVRDSLRIPTWLAKKSEVIKKLLSVQTGRDNKRTSLAHDSLAQTVPAFNLSKKDTATLSKVAFQLEGRIAAKEWKTRVDGESGWVAIPKFKKIGEYVIKDREGGDKKLPVLALNERHYDELERVLKEQGVRQPVFDAYMGMRRFLDQSQIIVYDRLRNLEKIDPTLIDEFRTSMGNVHNYFPHSRYGNFFIQAIDPKAKQGENAVKYRQHFNALNWRDANRWWAKNKDKIITSLEKENSDVNWRSLEWKGDKVKGLPEEVYDFPIPVDAVQQVLDAAVDRIPVESDEARKALRTALSEESANIMKSRGFGSHMIRRKNIPGFEQNDIKRVLYDYINGFSGWITKIEAAHDFGDVLKDLNARQRPNEYKYAVKYVHDMLQNSTRTDKWVANAKAFFFLNYLGGNLKTAVVNLTQNLVAGVPRLSIETGLTSASYEWTRAMKDIRLSVTEKGIANKKNLSSDEHRFLKDMFREGWGQSQFIREVSAQVGGAGSQIWQKTVRYAGLPMEIAERYNRLSIGLAAFRAARDGKITNKNTLAEFKIRPGEKAGFDAAKSFAEGVVTDAHFIYGKTNMPAFIRGSAGAKALSSAYTFRTFNHNLLSMWRWMLTSGDRQGKKAFAYSIGSIILLGGLSALPFYNSIASLLRQLFGVDYLGAEVRKLIPDHQRDLVMYGAPSLLGIGIGSSIGMELPIFDKIKSSQNLSEQAFEGIGQLIGIPAAMLKEALDVVDAVRNGRGDRAWEIVAPTFLKNIMVAHRLSTEGQTTMAGKPINFPGERGARTITDYEAGMKVLGFQPLSSTKSFEVYKTMEDLKAYKDNKLHELANKYMAAKNSGDIEGMSKVREDVRAWNIKMSEEGHPEHKIDLSKSIAARSKTAKPPRAMRGEARELMDLYK